MTKKQAKELAARLITEAVMETVYNWHTREIEFYGKPALSADDQALVNEALLKLSSKVVKNG